MKLPFSFALEIEEFITNYLKYSVSNIFCQRKCIIVLRIKTIRSRSPLHSVSRHAFVIIERLLQGNSCTSFLYHDLFDKSRISIYNNLQVLKDKKSLFVKKYITLLFSIKKIIIINKFF